MDTMDTMDTERGPLCKMPTDVMTLILECLFRTYTHEGMVNLHAMACSCRALQRAVHVFRMARPACFVVANQFRGLPIKLGHQEPSKKQALFETPRGPIWAKPHDFVRRWWTHCNALKRDLRWRVGMLKLEVSRQAMTILCDILENTMSNVRHQEVYCTWSEQERAWVLPPARTLCWSDSRIYHGERIQHMVLMDDVRVAMDLVAMYDRKRFAGRPVPTIRFDGMEKALNAHYNYTDSYKKLPTLVGTC